MNDKTITAFSREYAEEEAKGSAVDALPNGLKENVIQRNADHFEKHLRFLLRRYCLVEKEAVLKQFESVKRLIDARDYNKKCIGVGSRGVLGRLFPDLEKEVEE